MPSAPPFKPIVFVPSKSEENIRSFPVHRILAVAHPPIAEGPGGNHWCLYLSAGPMRTVRIDPNPSGIPGPTILGGSKANVVISELHEDRPSDAQHVDTLSVAPGLVVGQFIDAITNAGRHKYEFDETGRGCRMWTRDQVDLFLRLGLTTDPAEAQKVREDVSVEFAESKPTGVHLPLNRGAYYG